jgi:serine/threonine-protein kinase
MASVYLARAAGAPGFQKLVALKRIHAHLAKEKEYVEMFLDEARIASRITHANVCSVFDFGEVNGEYFIAMEYLVGEPLSRVHRRVVANAEERSSPLLPSRMARIIAQAAEGLHAAHELNDADGQSLNVVHRDVSAENLFVTYDGDTQVVDFGIAHARQRVHHTEAGQVKGTFPYMAPEQMTAAVVDRRVDVWALGAVLWELLTLRRLFLRDTDVNTMYAVLSGEIRPPSEYRSDVPPELDEIVLKALQRNPDERWQSAREMGKALRRFLAKQEELVGPAEIAEWMAELFPNGEARKHHLMEIARTSPDQIAADSPYQSELKSQWRNMAIPSTAKYRVPAPPPLPASLLVMVIGVATVLTLVALDWLRQ